METKRDAKSLVESLEIMIFENMHTYSQIYRDRNFLRDYESFLELKTTFEEIKRIHELISGGEFHYNSSSGVVIRENNKRTLSYLTDLKSIAPSSLVSLLTAYYALNRFNTYSEAARAGKELFGGPITYLDLALATFAIGTSLYFGAKAFENLKKSKLAIEVRARMHNRVAAKKFATASYEERKELTRQLYEAIANYCSLRNMLIDQRKDLYYVNHRGLLDRIEKTKEKGTTFAYSQLLRDRSFLEDVRSYLCMHLVHDLAINTSELVRHYNETHDIYTFSQEFNGLVNGIHMREMLSLMEDIEERIKMLNKGKNDAA